MPAINTNIAGVQYCQGASTKIAQLPDGVALELRPEPTNKFDRNAVQVYFGGKRLGYVPRTDSALVAKAIKEGLLESCALSKGVRSAMIIKWKDPKAARTEAEERYVETGSDILA